MPTKTAKTATELRRLLVADSIERARWMTRLLQLTRQEERERVLDITYRAREKREAGTA